MEPFLYDILNSYFPMFLRFRILKGKIKSSDPITSDLCVEHEFSVTFRKIEDYYFFVVLLFETIHQKAFI